MSTPSAPMPTAPMSAAPIPAAPLSVQYRAFFNTCCMESVHEKIRPMAESFVNFGEDVIVTFENEIQRLHTEENGILNLVQQITAVALGIFLTCCSSSAVPILVGAVVGLIYGEKIVHCLSVLKDSSPFLKIAVIAGFCISACAATHVCGAVFMAVAVAKSLHAPSVLQRMDNVVNRVRDVLAI